MGHAQLLLRQESVRGRNDDGDETGATWKVAENTDFSVLTNTSFRLRFLIQEVGGSDFADFKEVWEYNVNGGAWDEIDIGVGGAKAVGSVTSGFYVNGTDTTQQLGSGTFIDNNNAQIEGVSQGDATVPDMAGNDEFECENCLRLIIGREGLAAGGYVQIRITELGHGVLEQYNSASIINITLVGPAAAHVPYLRGQLLETHIPPIEAAPAYIPFISPAPPAAAPLPVIKFRKGQLLETRVAPLEAWPFYYPLIAPAPFVPTARAGVPFQMVELPAVRAVDPKRRKAFYSFPFRGPAVVPVRQSHIHGGSHWRHY